MRIGSTVSLRNSATKVRHAIDETSPKSGSLKCLKGRWDGVVWKIEEGYCLVELEAGSRYWIGVRDVVNTMN